MPNISQRSQLPVIINKSDAACGVRPANDNNKVAVSSLSAPYARAANVVPFRAIAALTDLELANFEHNYRRLARVSGGVYSLPEIMNEKARRTTGGLNGRQLVDLILALSLDSHDGFTTYADLWAALFPGTPWCGNKTVRAIMAIMDIAVVYCVDNALPIVTTLIVRTGTRTHSKNAVDNIYEAAKRYGASVGPNAQDFVDSQILESLYLHQADKAEGQRS